MLIEARNKAHAERLNLANKRIKTEATLDRAFASPSGLLRLAKELANPVRQQLDYKGIIRNFAVTELLPVGMPAVYDKDVQWMGAASISNVAMGSNGAVREVIVNSDRVNTGDGFEIAVVPKIPFKQTFIRRYNVVKRVADKLRQGIQQREDLLWLAQLETAATMYTGTVRKHKDGNIPIVVGTGKLTKGALSDAFTQLSDRRLPTRYVLGDAYLRSSIMNWTFQDLDQAGMQEMREAGYLGDMWGASFFYSDQLSVASANSNLAVAYVLTDPQLLSWIPVRCDLQIAPADDPSNFMLGFSGYELLGMTVHNAWGVVKITYPKETYS